MAALLHDTIDEKLNLASKEQIVEYLKSQSLKQKTIDDIMYIIENQSFKKTIGNNNKLKTIEAKIVQDADRLDALGAIGIARLFTVGGSTGRIIHNPNIGPIEHFAKDEYLKYKNTSINHFYEKTLKLKDLMNTKTAKTIAKNRHAFIETFLNEFYDEWNEKK